MLRPPRRLRTRSVARYPLLELREHDVALASDPSATWTVLTIELTDWCSIAARTIEGGWVLVEQHRHGVDALTLEPAGGIIDDGEAPMAAALRELLEETGYFGESAVSLGWVHPNPALSSNRSHIFFADGVRRVAEPHVSADEHTRVVLLDGAELEGALSGGAITHALGILALERALARVARGG